jgi:hypothetical protein
LYLFKNASYTEICVFILGKNCTFEVFGPCSTFEVFGPCTTENFDISSPALHSSGHCLTRREKRTATHLFDTSILAAAMSGV